VYSTVAIYVYKYMANISSLHGLGVGSGLVAYLVTR